VAVSSSFSILLAKRPRLASSLVFILSGAITKTRHHTSSFIYLTGKSAYLTGKSVYITGKSVYLTGSFIE